MQLKIDENLHSDAADLLNQHGHDALTSEGIIVLQVLGRIIPLFDTETLAGHLWIVDEHQVRIRGTNSSEDGGDLFQWLGS